MATVGSIAEKHLAFVIKSLPYSTKTCILQLKCILVALIKRLLSKHLGANGEESVGLWERCRAFYSLPMQDLPSVLLRGRYASTAWCENRSPLFFWLARRNLEEAAKRNVGIAKATARLFNAARRNYKEQSDAHRR